MDELKKMKKNALRPPFNFLELLRERHTTYEFSNQKVDSKIIQTILEAGRLSPSSHNAQPWSFILVTDEGLIDQLMQICAYGKFHTHPAAAIAIVLEEIYENQPGLLTENLAAFRESHRYLNIGFAAANMVNEAASLGIATCIVSPIVEKANALLHVPAGKETILILGLGTEKDASSHPPKTRKKLDDIIHYNFYADKKGN